MSDLWEHFVDQAIEAHMYASQWFLTLFTAKFPLFLVFHILDIVLSEVRHSKISFIIIIISVVEIFSFVLKGTETIFSVALALLKVSITVSFLLC